MIHFCWYGNVTREKKTCQVFYPIFCVGHAFCSSEMGEEVLDANLMIQQREMGLNFADFEAVQD